MPQDISIQDSPVMKDITELCIPSILGSEKVAIENAAAIAERMGFPPTRIEDLKTAVSEACTNAIEHGNLLNQNMMVNIAFIARNSSLQICIQDEGAGFGEVQQPQIEDDIPQRRGWGVFLIRNLVNHFSHETIPGKGNLVRLTFNLEK